MLRINKHIGMTFLDYPTPEDHAVIVYFYGCSHACHNCHSQNLQDYDCEYSHNVSIDSLIGSILNSCDRYKTNKVVFSGGDPLYVCQRFHLANLILDDRLKDISIALYTGFTYEEVKSFNNTGWLDRISYIICGRYDESQKQESRKTDHYFQLASKNQEVWDQTGTLISSNGRVTWGGG